MDEENSYFYHCFQLRLFGAFNRGMRFTNYETQRRWVGGLKNVTLPMILEKFYYAKVLLEVGGWSK